MNDISNETRSIIKALRAIAEGYPAHGEEDRCIVVENPDFRPDDGSDPCLVIDVEELARSTPQHGDDVVERERIVRWLREQSDLGADKGISSAKGSTRRAAFGGGSLALSRAADAIEKGEHVSPDEDEIICEACLKPVRRGHFVHCYDDVGEVHVDCDRPNAFSDDPAAKVMLGEPLIRASAAVSAPARNDDLSVEELIAELADVPISGEDPAAHAGPIDDLILHARAVSQGKSYPTPARNGEEEVERSSDLVSLGVIELGLRAARQGAERKPCTGVEAIDMILNLLATVPRASLPLASNGRDEVVEECAIRMDCLARLNEREGERDPSGREHGTRAKVYRQAAAELRSLKHQPGRALASRGEG